MRVRFTIARLIALVAFCGVGFAAVRSPSPLWAATTASMALTIVVVAVIRVRYEQGARRAYWTGFALCGGLYLVASLTPWIDGGGSPALVTTAVLDLAYPHLTSPAPPPPQASMGMMMMSGMGPMGGYAGTAGGTGSTPPSRWQAWTDPNAGGISLASPEPFRRIGHSLLTILMGCLGGWYARHRHDRGRESE